MFDSNLVLIDGTANLVASGSSGWTDVGVSLAPETWELIVPDSTASTGLVVEVDAADDASGTNPETFLTLIDTGGSVGTGYESGSATDGRIGIYLATGMTAKPYRNVDITCTGASTGMDFGKVSVGMVTGGRYNKF